MAKPKIPVIAVPGHPLSSNQRRAAHWSVQYRDSKLYRDMVATITKAVYGGPPLERARITATLVYTRRPFRDTDAAYASLKPCVDGLIDGGLLVSDDPEHLVGLELAQVTGQEKMVKLEVSDAANGCS